MRLDKYLSDMGLGTRSSLRKMIRSGQVRVNGQTIKDPGAHLTDRDQVQIGTEIIRYAPFEYYMMNKPQGIITATEDKKHRTVLDLMEDSMHRRDLSPAGRLDIDTEGLLLITNDGQLIHRLLSPSQHVDKVYFVRVDGLLGEDEVERFRRGIRIEDDVVTLPATLEILHRGDAQSEARVIIHEGKFHQIKKMFAACGREVIFLKRLTMGPLSLDPGLEPGQYRKLTEEEIQLLKGWA